MEATATVHPAQYAVRLSATGATGTVHWTRVRAGTADTDIGTGDLLWDYAPPLNTPVTYVAVDDADTDVTAQVTVAAAGPVLASTTAPIAYPVTVVDYRPLRGEGVTRWHPVLGRNDPFVTIHPALYPSGLLRLRAATATERTQLIELLAGGEPLTLRSTCADRVDDMTFVMTSWSDPFANDRRKRPPAYLEIEFQQVTDSIGAPIPIPDRTYQTLLDDHADYQEVLGSYATYRAVLEGPSP